MLPFSEVNLLAVMISTLACMMLGMLWYGPFFGQSWMKLHGIKMDKNMKGPGMCMLYGLINTFVMACGVALLLAISNPTSLQQALLYTAAIWIGFTATMKASDSIWARKPWRLFWIDVGYSFFAVLAVVLILMNWPV
jgi:hypothetical protein